MFPFSIKQQQKVERKLNISIGVLRDTFNPTRIIQSNCFQQDFQLIFVLFSFYFIFFFFIFQTFISLMEKLNGIVEECFYLTDFVKFNLFMLDCRRVNRVLISLVREIQDLVTDYFKALNQKENRRFVTFCGIRKC